MYFSKDEILNLFNAALDFILLFDKYLLQVDANERSITHRLAIYLDEIFSTWDVDCEYNRINDDIKVIKSMKKTFRDNNITTDVDDSEARTVYPDIIIHHRGTKENLLVIEVKKSTNKIPEDIDINKLKQFKAQLGYKYALFLKLETGCENPKVKTVHLF